MDESNPFAAPRSLADAEPRPTRPRGPSPLDDLMTIVSGICGVGHAANVAGANPPTWIGVAGWAAVAGYFLAEFAWQTSRSALAWTLFAASIGCTVVFFLRQAIAGM